MPRKPTISEVDRIRKSVLLMAHAGKIRTRLDVLIPRARWRKFYREIESTYTLYNRITGKVESGAIRALPENMPITFNVEPGIECRIWCERD